jgi:type I restriction enzyme, S subunit
MTARKQRAIIPLSDGRRLDPPPAGWSWHLLCDVARLESGHTPSRSRPDWWGGEVPWIALPDIRQLDGKEAHETTENTNEQGIANSSARVLPKGTVVVSRTASVGFVTVMGRPMATSQDFFNWVCGEKLEPWFLAYLLMASRGYIQSLASGAVHKTVYMPTAEGFRVCIPDPRTQRTIVARLRAQLATANRVRAAAEAELEAAEALPASLLRSAFSDSEN